MKKIRLGSGAGYSGDRIEPAVELAEKGDIQYLCFECLAERTIAIAQQAKMKDPAQGYDALLAARMEAEVSGSVQSRDAAFAQIRFRDRAADRLRHGEQSPRRFG